jgi:pilus assembly protein Flp/PilA
MNAFLPLAALRSLALRLKHDRSGVTALEYGLIASLVAIAIISGVSLLGTDLSTEFSYIAGKV